MTSSYDESKKLKEKKEDVEKFVLNHKIDEELFLRFEKMEVWNILQWADRRSKNNTIYNYRNRLLDEVRTYVIQEQNEVQQYTKESVEKLLLNHFISEELFILLDKMEVWNVLRWAERQSKGDTALDHQTLLLIEVQKYVAEAEESIEQFKRKAFEGEALPTRLQAKDLWLSYVIPDRISDLTKILKSKLITPDSISSLTRTLKAELEKQLRRSNIIFNLCLFLGPPILFLLVLIFNAKSLSPHKLITEFKEQSFSFFEVMRELISLATIFASAYLGFRTYEHFHLIFFGDQSKYLTESQTGFSFRCFAIGVTVFLLAYALFVTMLSRPIFKVAEP